MHPSIYMLEKELIENKNVTRIPLFLLVCGTLLFISLLMNNTLQHNLFFEMEFGGDISDVHIEFVDDFNTFIIMLVGFISLMLSSLYFPRTFRKERKEGSSMFWRSMPVTNNMTHIVKLGFGLFVIPVVCSVLVICADFLLWGLNLATENRLALLFEQRSLGYAVQHWLNYLSIMWVIAVTMLPLACFTLVISQIFNSPILVMFVGGFVLKWISIVMLNSDIVGEFYHAIFNLPLQLMTSSNMFTAFEGAGWGNLFVYIMIGIASYWISHKLYSTDELSLKSLLTR